MFSARHGNRRGRKPQIGAPVGSKGCPRCKQVLPLIDPVTQDHNFAASGYCKPCALAKTMEYKRAVAEKRAAERGVAPPVELRAEKIEDARITPFPKIDVNVPQCSCCHRAPTQQVSKLPFCDRCGYYVAACGRCVDHSFREFVPELLGKPDPAPLPPMYAVPVPPYVGRTSGVRGRDETDLPADQRQ